MGKVKLFIVLICLVVIQGCSERICVDGKIYDCINKEVCVQISTVGCINKSDAVTQIDNVEVKES